MLTVALSENAVALLRLRAKGVRVPVTDGRVEAYRELTRAGIMVSVGTFIKGDDCVFQLTHQGWERRHELLRTLPRFSASAISRSLLRAVSRIARGVSAAR